MDSNRDRSNTVDHLFLNESLNLDDENFSLLASRRKLSIQSSSDSNNSLTLSYNSGNMISTSGIETLQRPESAVTNSSYSSMDSSSSSSNASISMKKSLKNFHHHSFLSNSSSNVQNSPLWESFSSNSSSHQITNKDRIIAEKKATIESQKKEIDDLKKQLKDERLNLVEYLSSETTRNEINISRQNADLENASLKVELAELHDRKDQEIQILKAQLEDLDNKYQQPLKELAKESDEKSHYISMLKNDKSKLEQTIKLQEIQINEKHEESKSLRQQMSGLQKVFSQQSQITTSTLAKSESNWFNQIENKSILIRSLQEQNTMMKTYNSGLQPQLEEVIIENKKLKESLEPLKRKTVDCENKLKDAKSKLEYELAAMRTRHKDKFNNAINVVRNENLQLKNKFEMLEEELKEKNKIILKMKNEKEWINSIEICQKQPDMMDQLYDKLRECISEIQITFDLLSSAGNSSDLDTTISLSSFNFDISITTEKTTINDRLQQLNKIQFRIKQYRSLLEDKFLSEIGQSCNIQ